ncbi:MAG: tRNA (adenosine(37)-N6)-dimethylallyltransferase MiaA [Acidobacteria bacterium]|nr:tRNA (adenosine(37)-N6)-dimethylallyltransferase MiaA [Acidobacteriota bacterium]
MQPFTKDWPLVAIVGPTGSGKSTLALRLAHRFRGEIVNCDSVQVYRHFDIGSAKLAPGRREGIPHHLMDVLNPDELFTAGDYARMARQTLAGIASRGNLPLIAGGAGFYLRALLDGLFEGPQRDERLRARLTARERRRPGSLARLLSRLDPGAAGRIHPNDTNKMIRALEICLLARRPATEMLAQGAAALRGFAPLLIGLDPPRQELYRVLNARCLEMFEHGLADEARRILALGYPRQVKPFESLGYKQALLLIDGTFTFDQALEELRKQTRRYAKRQWTWFKKDKRVSWIPGFGDSPPVQQAAEETLLNFLTGRTGLLPEPGTFPPPPRI